MKHRAVVGVECDSLEEEFPLFLPFLLLLIIFFKGIACGIEFYSDLGFLENGFIPGIIQPGLDLPDSALKPVLRGNAQE